MVRKQQSFPLVADHEPLLGMPPTMQLYEESDLISNIRGTYQEPVFLSHPVTAVLPPVQQQKLQEELDVLPPLFESKPSNYSRKERRRQISQPEKKTQGQAAREKAREDLKRKRSASYLKDGHSASAKVYKHETHQPVVEDKTPQLVRLAQRLRQTEYILADLPTVYSLKKEDREQNQSRPPKNSYDFLRNSQVYNYPERKKQQERQVAQELNLTHIDEEAND